MKFDKEHIKKILRPSVSDYTFLGNPSEEEIKTKMADVEALSEAEQRRLMNKLNPPSMEELKNSWDDFKDELDKSLASKVFLNCNLSADFQLTIGVTATVPFSSSGRNQELAKLGLTALNGTFTSTKDNNILLVSFQLRFSAESSSTGYRQGSISVGTEFFSRTQTLTLGVATHVSGCSPIKLDRGESFNIKAFNTGTSTTLISTNNASRLIITSI